MKHRVSLHGLVIVVIVVVIMSNSDATAFDEYAAKLPQETIAYFHFSDVPKLIAAASKTESVQNARGLPIIQFIEKSIFLTDQHDQLGFGQSGLVQIVNELMAGDLITGPASGFLLESDGKLKWMVLVNLANAHIRPVASIRIQGREIQPKRAGAIQYVELNGVFFCQKERELFVGNDLSLIKRWNSQRGLSPTLPLNKYRKHQTIARECFHGSISENAATCYIDLNRLFKYLARNADASSSIGPIIDTIEARDILALGLKLLFPEDQNQDFGIHGFLLQGLPRRGFNQILQLRNRLHRDDFKFASDVDFAAIVQLNLEVFANAVNEVDQQIAKSFSRSKARSRLTPSQKKAYLKRTIVNTFPVLALATLMNDSERANFSGRFDLAGWLLENDSFRFVNTISYAWLAKSRPKIGLTVFRNIPGSEALVNEKYRSVDFLTISPEMVDDMRRRRESLQREGITPLELQRPVFTIFRNRIAVYSQENLFQREVDEEFEFLSQTARFKRVWRGLSGERVPGAFAYFGKPYYLWDLYFRLMNLHKSRAIFYRSSATSNDKFEHEIRAELIRLSDRWLRFSKYSEDFGPAGFAVFDKGNGLEFRFIQFKR